MNFKSGLILAIVLFFVFLGSVSLVNAEAGAPGFAIQLADGRFVEYSADVPTGQSTWTVNDDLINATVSQIGEGRWRLSISPSAQGLSQVWFPYESETVALGGNPADDIVYYPLLTGFAYKNVIAPPGQWKTDGNHMRLSHPCYPGACFSPLIVLADDDAARMIAAANWPPRPVTPLWSRGQLVLKYEERVASGQTQTYDALVSQIASADLLPGEKPWQLALDPYQDWLQSQMTVAGLYPLPYPEWLKNIHGWLHVSLSDEEQFDINFIREKWNRWKDVFPWIQFWGQMSPWHGSLNGSTPPGTGCCILRRTMDPRYLPDLVNFAGEVKQAGGHVSYYSRPLALGEESLPLPLDDLAATYRPPDSTTPINALAFLQDWLRRNRDDYGANALYLDVLGATYLGDPLFVANLFKPGGSFPEGSVIEWPVDIYPAAYLIGGSIWGGLGRHSSIYTPQNTPTDAAYPNFGRYLLNDRIFFSGDSNGDFYLRGSGPGGAGIYSFFNTWLDFNRSCLGAGWEFLGSRCEPYWTERQTFLLGAKFDIGESADDPRFLPQAEIMNPAMRAAIAQRDATNWWAREPRYLDTLGLDNVSTGVDIRRFVDKNGVQLLAIDNWRQRDSVSFSFYGENRTIFFPTDPSTGQPYQLYLTETAPPPNLTRPTPPTPPASASDVGATPTSQPLAIINPKTINLGAIETPAPIVLTPPTPPSAVSDQNSVTDRPVIRREFTARPLLAAVDNPPSGDIADNNPNPNIDVPAPIVTNNQPGGGGPGGGRSRPPAINSVVASSTTPFIVDLSACQPPNQRSRACHLSLLQQIIRLLVEIIRQLSLRR